MHKLSTPIQKGFSWQCYGCGKCNKSGLQADTLKTEEGYLCEWQTSDNHVAHPGKYHHGVITTICFCHGAWAATAENYEVDGKTIKDPLDYFYVNQSISYEILQPIKLNSIASILAKVLLAQNGIAHVDFEVRVKRELCAVANTKLNKVYANEMEF